MGDFVSPEGVIIVSRFGLVVKYYFNFYLK